MEALAQGCLSCLADAQTQSYKAASLAETIRMMSRDAVVYSGFSTYLSVGRSVAQPGSALASGARGREFKSPRSDQRVLRHQPEAKCNAPKQLSCVKPTGYRLVSENLKFKKTMAVDYDEPLPISPGVVRVVANNSGPLTFHGTNTYLVGTETVAVIDPGPEDDTHIDAILTAAAGRPISHIVITHRHRDHVDGTALLKSKCGAMTVAFDGTRTLRSGLQQAGAIQPDFINLGFEPDLLVTDGDAIAGSDWELEAIHTPGHAPDHICLALSGRDILFSGDHVMSWNTSVIAPPEGRMVDYLASLERLLERPEQLYLPGHGGRLENAGRTVKAYLLHRRWREQAILEAISKGTNTIRDLVAAIYSSVDDAVVGAAALSVLAHVELLHERGLVSCAPHFGLDAKISVT
jgi:glyoxylase-like metal-dependent hydrolase (beta-lactamase superfamily II)